VTVRRSVPTLVGLAAVGAVVAFWIGRSRYDELGVGAPAPAPTERVRVEVLNAAGVTGLARRATGTLRDAGFDVVQFGNARSFARDSSVVIDRVGRTDLAQAVANVLGIGNVLSEPDPNLYVEVTVLLGSNWSDSTARRGGSRDTPPRGVWDPRGWLGR